MNKPPPCMPLSKQNLQVYNMHFRTLDLLGIPKLLYILTLLQNMHITVYLLQHMEAVREYQYFLRPLAHKLNSIMDTTFLAKE